MNNLVYIIINRIVHHKKIRQKTIEQKKNDDYRTIFLVDPV